MTQPLIETPATQVTAAQLTEPTAAQSNSEYRQLRDFLFGDALKSKRFEARLGRLADVIADQAATTPGEMTALRAPAIKMVESLMNCYFGNVPLADDPLHATGQTRLDILAGQRASEKLPLHKAVTEIYANVRKFAELSVEKALREGVARSQGVGIA